MARLARPKTDDGRPKRWLWILASLAAVGVGVYGAKWTVDRMARR